MTIRWSFLTGFFAANHRYEELLLTHPSRDDHQEGEGRGEDYSSRVMSRRLDLELLPAVVRLGLYGSCNGILCLANKLDGLVYLCNPTTREYLKLPDSLFSHEIYSIEALGFGFDLSTNDYKVIKIAMGINDDLLYVEIFKLSRNCWSKLETNLTSNDIWVCEFDSGVFMNGSFHWWLECFRSDFPQCMCIITFDFHNETFGRIECPNPEGAWKLYSPLTLLDNSLALITTNSFTPNSNFDVWVMMEYGNKESWIKKCSVETMFPIYAHIKLPLE